MSSERRLSLFKHSTQRDSMKEIDDGRKVILFKCIDSFLKFINFKPSKSGSLSILNLLATLI